MVQGLIGRIDQSMSLGAESMRQRTDQAELRMRSMLQKVDEAWGGSLRTLKGFRVHVPL